MAEARLAEVERIKREFLAERAQLEEVNEAALRRCVREGDVTLLDVRPPEEYDAGHIPGAISMPLPDLVKQLADPCWGVRACSERRSSPWRPRSPGAGGLTGNLTTQ